MQHRRQAVRRSSKLFVVGAVASLINESSVEAFATAPFQMRPAATNPAIAKPKMAANGFSQMQLHSPWRNNTSRASLPSSQSEPTDRQPSSTNRRYLRELFLMMRPVNFPIVALFHALGVHLSLQSWKSTSSTNPTLTSLLKHPSMMMVLLSLLLVTSTSMITNDYYDARNGVDVAPPSSPERDAHYHRHPLAQGLLPYNIAKTFDSYLYALLLLSSAFVPGVIPRLSVLSGAIVTYLYTVHLKPRTFVKNYSCAALVALSPITSGLAAREVLAGRCGGNVASCWGGMTTTMMSIRSPLMYLVVALFAGITSREILMDITDFDSDAKAGIQTIPVKYGTDVAAAMAFGWSALSGAAACALPLVKGIPVLTQVVDGQSLKVMLRSLISTPMASFSSLASVMTIPSMLRLALSVIGSTMLLHRAYSVVKSKRERVDLAERAVGSSLFSVLLVLASFV